MDKLSFYLDSEHLNNISKFLYKNKYLELDGRNIVSITIPAVCDYYSFSKDNKSDTKTKTKQEFEVKGIVDSLFKGSKYLKKIDIKDTKISKIDKESFKNCTSLEKVVFPNSLKEIGGSAFEGCTSLKDLEIPDSVKVISYNAFKSCTSLEKLVLPNRLQRIGESAFEGCTSLKFVKIPDSVSKISNNAFKDIEVIYYKGAAVDDGKHWGAKSCSQDNCDDSLVTVVENESSITEKLDTEEGIVIQKDLNANNSSKQGQQDKEKYDNLEESVLVQLYEEREKFQEQLADISKQLKELEKENQELKEENKKIAGSEKDANAFVENEKDIINIKLDSFLKEILNKPDITENTIEDKLQFLFTYIKSVESEHKNLVELSNKKQSDDLEKEKTELKAQISDLEKEKIILEQGKKVLEELVNDLQKKEIEYKTSYEVEKKSFEDYKKQYSRVFNIDEYIKAYDTAKFEDLKVNNECLEKDVKSLKSQLKDKVNEIKNLTIDKGDLQGQLTAIEKQNKKLEDKNKQYFLQITEFLQEAQKFKSEKENFKRQLAEKIKEVESLTSELEDKKNQINILIGEKGELQGQLMEKDRQIERLEQKKVYKQK